MVGLELLASKSQGIIDGIRTSMSWLIPVSQGSQRVVVTAGELTANGCIVLAYIPLTFGGQDIPFRLLIVVEYLDTTMGPRSRGSGAPHFRGKGLIPICLG